VAYARTVRTLVGHRADQQAGRCGTRTVNRDLETKARTLAGWKPYITKILDPEPSWVIGAYHQLWRIEHAFRMSKHDLRAQAGLPPQTRIHRRPPRCGVRCVGHLPPH
jgi:hypothetical protein